jgi:pimeloyl-ACP methyl ester carboxylesterase
MNSLANTSGEKLDHTFHPGNNRGTLLILGHGVTGNKDRPLMVALAEGLSECGWPCLRISFSGNGLSEGRFQESTITKELADLKAVLDTVPQEIRIAYAGHSMGGAVGVLTAATDPRIRALVSLAGMTQTAAFAEREFGMVKPDEGCMWDEESCPLSTHFMEDMRRIGNTLAAAAEATCPWLLIHGDADDVVPIQDGLEAFAAANCEKEWLAVEGGEHSFGEESYPRIIEAMDRWFTKHLG